MSTPRALDWFCPFSVLGSRFRGVVCSGQVRSMIEHDILKLVLYRKVFIDTYYDFDDDQGAV